MRQQFKPYTKVALLHDIGVSAIPLTDSSNGLLECNFVSVTASSRNNNLDSGNFFVVAASSIASVGKTENSIYPAAAMLLNSSALTSGVPGGVASTEKGVVELLLPDTDRVSTIYVSQHKAQQTFFMINYGQVFTGNALRDYQRPKGN